LLVELLRRVFSLGIFMVPMIQPHRQPPATDPLVLAKRERFGVIVSGGRSVLRLVVGQDWSTTYSGMTGSGHFHRFVISSSLRLEISEPGGVQVLRQR
jgi:hypothetical protein